jgi:DNA-binding NtrC family response regulator
MFQSALQSLHEKTFQLFLPDLKLPGSQGLGTFEKIVTAHPGIACLIPSGTDDKAVVHSLTRILRGADHDVVPAPNGEDVLAHMRAHKIDFIIADYKLSEKAREPL